MCASPSFGEVGARGREVEATVRDSSDVGGSICCVQTRGVGSFSPSLLSAAAKADCLGCSSVVAMAISTGLTEPISSTDDVGTCEQF